MILALRVYLVVVVLANIAGLTVMVSSFDSLLSQYPKLSPLLVFALFASGILSIAAVVLMWIWRRSGIYLIFLTYTVMLCINLYYEAPLAHTLLGPVGLAILSVLLWCNRRKYSAKQLEHDDN